MSASIDLEILYCLFFKVHLHSVLCLFLYIFKKRVLRSDLQKYIFSIFNILRFIVIVSCVFLLYLVFSTFQGSSSLCLVSAYLVFHSAPPIQDPPPVRCHIFIFPLENVQLAIIPRSCQIFMQCSFHIFIFPLENFQMAIMP